jgi:hypothetical protein
MKQVAWILVFLAVLAVLIAMPVVARQSHPWPDCAGRVVMIKGPHGEPRECVCLGGTLSTCFSPGP